jgi:hypothetical protein
MNSPTRQCEQCGAPAVVIDTGNTALCAKCALPRFREERAHVGKSIGTRGPFARRATKWR